MASRFVEQVVDGPREHDLSRVAVRWRSDGSVQIKFPNGVGPVEVDTVGIGNFRRARFAVRRRQIGQS